MDVWGEEELLINISSKRDKNNVWKELIVPGKHIMGAVQKLFPCTECLILCLFV